MFSSFFLYQSFYYNLILVTKVDDKITGQAHLSLPSDNDRFLYKFIFIMF